MNLDWLLGAKKQLDPNTGAVINAGDIGGIFSNPNFIQALGQGAGAVTGEGTWQADMGNIASNWARNKAIQEAGAKQLARRNEFDQRMVQALAGQFTSPEDDPTKPNKITLDRGQWKAEGGSPVVAPEATSGFADEDLGLESNPPLGGSDLRDFLRYSQDNWA